MQHQCLKCHAIADLPDGHKLNVCPTCGAIQSKVQAAQNRETPKYAHASPEPQVTSSASLNQAKPKSRKSPFLKFAVLAISGALIAVIYSISKPGYDSYNRRAQERTASSVRPASAYADMRTESNFELAKAGLGAIIVLTNTFNTRLQEMPYMAHTALPELHQSLNAIVGDAAAIKVPICAENAKQLIIWSMETATAAVRTNHVFGAGINHPEVVRQIQLSTRLAADAQAAMLTMNC